jgi:hypothetical protein
VALGSPAGGFHRSAAHGNGTAPSRAVRRIARRASCARKSSIWKIGSGASTRCSRS